MIRLNLPLLWTISFHAKNISLAPFPQEELLDVSNNSIGFHVWGISLDDTAIFVDQELREIPLDPRGEDATFLRLQIGIEDRFVRSVDEQFGESRESRVVFVGAELVNLLDGPGSLVEELVAREIQHFEPPGFELIIDRLEKPVLRGENTVRRRIHYQKNLAFVTFKQDLRTAIVFDRDFIDAHNSIVPLLLA